jgi:hypothetical protein
MVKAPFEVRKTAVPVASGQASGDKLYLVPLRFCKMKFIGEVRSRIGNWYKTEYGQFIGLR